MYADLHIHTNASDGTWNIEELLNNIINKNISLFSITDHDTFENSVKMLKRTLNYDGRFVIGCETSCSYNGTVYHITTYNFDHKNRKFQELLIANKKVWNQFNDDIIKSLSIKNLNISFNKYQEYHYSRSRGASKSINFLMDEGIINTLSEFVKLMGTLNCTLEYQAPEVVLNILKQAGATTFLAHPSAYTKSFLHYDELDKWLEFGVSGFECYSPYSKSNDSVKYVEYCNNNHALISGGSDCHGNFLPERKLGHPQIKPDQLNLNFL